MALISGQLSLDASADPFGERQPMTLSMRKQVLGGDFRFVSNSASLLALVESAYGGLPSHRLQDVSADFRIELRLVPGENLPWTDEPPPVQTQSGTDMLCGVIDASNYVVISPMQQRALVVVSEQMLGFPYHLRYELIEFAVFVLATRSLGLIPLHGACVGKNGRGVLLLGASGAGKSTTALHGLLQGLDFLAEDTVLVHPQTLLVTGVANYVHVKADALQFIDDARTREWIAAAPVIRRRSGIEKFEADIRHGIGQLAAQPLKLAGAVFVSRQRAEDPEQLLTPVATETIASRLRADQPYAAEQEGWSGFTQQLGQMGMHELRRGDHPDLSVQALRHLLDHMR